MPWSIDDRRLDSTPSDQGILSILESESGEGLLAPHHALPAKLPSMDERASALTVWWEAGALIRRHPAAVVLPTAFLGMIVEIPYLLPDSRYVLQVILAFLTQAFAFYLYVAYAEEVTLEAQSTEHIPLREVLVRVLLAAPAVPLVMVASVAAIAL